MILDCENEASIYSSLESAYGLTKSQLDAAFDALAQNSEYVESVSDEELLDSLGLREIENPFDETYWFHATRTQITNEFRNGLLPQNQVLERIWDMLFELLEGAFTKDTWLEFRQGIESEYSDSDERVRGYRRTVPDPDRWGPFGYLIGAEAIRKREHYFKMPELIEDISVGFKTRYNFDLPGRFIASTAPCLVKFRHDGSKLDNVAKALNYLYMTKFNEPDFIFNPSFSADGIVPRSRVVKVEFLESHS